MYYDGKIWKDFLKYNGNDYLNAPRNLCNLSREEMIDLWGLYTWFCSICQEKSVFFFKWENIIVAGIIPEMTKEPKSLNIFLEPIVDEFKAFWRGVKLTTSQSGIPLTYRGAILLASADLPAVRKLCGKVFQHIVAVPNVLDIFGVVLVKKLIILVSTESCGLHVTITVIVSMLKWCAELPPKASMMN